MFNNSQLNVDRINQQIQELERLKQNYQAMQMQPQNIINVGNGQNIEFEARYLKDNEKVDEILVTRKTAFISPKNGFMKIKEIDGTITEYQLISPKDEKDLKIEELERKLKEYEREINTTNNEVKQPNANDYEQYDTGSTIIGKAIPRKAK